MMEVNHWLPKTLKQDYAAQFPFEFLSPISLTMTTTSGRVQIRVQHSRPSIMNAAITTMEQSSARKTYEQTPSNGANGATQAP